MNILTFDIEEWFHILDNDLTKSEKDWLNFESRIEFEMNTIFEIIKTLSDEGISIVLVEQNAVKASAIADHIYLLDQGEITFSGKPEQIEDNDIIKRAYLGDISES